MKTKFTGGYIYNELPEHRNLSNVIKVAIVFLIFASGVMLVSYLNDENRITLQQIDRNQRTINQERRIQLVKIARLNAAMKYENIESRASELGLTEVAVAGSLFPIPADQFDTKLMAFGNHRMPTSTKEVVQKAFFADARLPVTSSLKENVR